MGYDPSLFMLSHMDERVRSTIGDIRDYDSLRAIFHEDHIFGESNLPLIIIVHFISCNIEKGFHTLTFSDAFENIHYLSRFTCI